MSRITKSILPLIAVAAGVAYWQSAPATVDENTYAALSGDASAGEGIFIAGGCASCHAAPDAQDKTLLSGGQAFPSDFGTFYAPNISPSDAGLGGWSLTEFASALTLGTGRQNEHLYPAFPYTSYVKMEPQQVADLYAYMQTLPVSDTPSLPHDVQFPFNIRRGIGLWKALFLENGYVVADLPDGVTARGRELVETLAHCAECHTPRNALGALDRERWMAGAPNPSGQGNIPGLTPAQLDWSAADIAYYLETGFTPDFDSVGGHMAAVVDNFAQLSAADREAVAAYIKALPAAE
ncbi:c-type cytochrome [Sagittula sp. SSi028]|uniref:c-type cytochrome n=1 Tax=Sagittula sp. SSi028 TaxID=3400636 RepID=UPI003AF8BE72